VKVGEVYTGRWLRAEDLEGHEALVQIDKVHVHELPDGKRKLALAFVGKAKQLLLNPTNARTIASILGTDETDAWAGRRIRLHVEPVTFQGRMVRGIRVKAAGEIKRFA
jgi:hypothetical protein